MAGLIIGDNNFSTGTLGSGVTFPVGHILQVKSTTKRDKWSSSSVNATWSAVTGLSVDITPSSATNEIFIMYNINVVHAAGSHTGVAVGLYKAGTIITGAKGVTGGSSPEAVTNVAIHRNENDANAQAGVQSMNYLDIAGSSGSAITYAVYIFNASGSAFVSSVNTSTNNTSEVYNTEGVSTITVMEVSA